MQAAAKLDIALLHAMRAGADALPEDPRELAAHLATILALLEEKATEFEPTWAAACTAAAEIETLHALEATVAERAASVAAGCLSGVRAKLVIWRALGPGAEDGDIASVRDRLILSVDADLARLAGS